MPDWTTILTLFTAVMSAVAAALSAKSALDTRRDARGQLALALSERVRNLWPILPSNANPDDVRDALSTLDTIALSLEQRLVDFDVVQQFMGDAYMVIYEGLADTSIVEGYNLTGDQILSDHKAAARLYTKLRDWPQ